MSAITLQEHYARELWDYGCKPYHLYEHCGVMCAYYDHEQKHYARALLK